MEDLAIIFNTISIISIVILVPVFLVKYGGKFEKTKWNPDFMDSTIAIIFLAKVILNLLNHKINNLEDCFSYELLKDSSQWILSVSLLFFIIYRISLNWRLGRQEKVLQIGKKVTPWTLSESKKSIH